MKATTKEKAKVVAACRTFMQEWGGPCGLNTCFRQILKGEVSSKFRAKQELMVLLRDYMTQYGVDELKILRKSIEKEKRQTKENANKYERANNE